MAKEISSRSGGITMTEGPLAKNMLIFSIPLIFSQLLEVMFNLSDVAVVEKEPKVEGRSMIMFLTAAK